MFVNISAYKFIQLDKLPTLRADLDKACQRYAIKGTILLASEGININLVGSQQNIDSIKSVLLSIDGLADLSFKQSLSELCSFARLKVRIREEIITIGAPDMLAHKATAPHLSASEFKQWLDDGRDITVLDTRNHYEIEYGTFANAVDLHIDHFSEFPAAIDTLGVQQKDKPIVIFCTGGVRCEKAAVVMHEHGFENVYQLDGGILKYFEEQGGAHYQGDCFVFDDRIAVTPMLEVASQKSV